MGSREPIGAEGSGNRPKAGGHLQGRGALSRATAPRVRFPPLSWLVPGVTNPTGLGGNASLHGEPRERPDKRVSGNRGQLALKCHERSDR